MKGEIHTLNSLEKMVSWRATFKQYVSLGSAPKFVCLMKKLKDIGYQWKMPLNEHAEDANLDTLQDALDSGRLEFVSGKLPPKITAPKKKKVAV